MEAVIRCLLLRSTIRRRMRQAEEQKALKRILDNPLKMKQIRGAVEERKAELEGRHKKEKKEKKHKKEKK